MRTRSGLSISAVLALLVLSPGARAETAAQAISRWGLVGSWKIDCTTAPTEQAPKVSWVIRNGAAFYERNYGTHQDSSPVVSAIIKPDGTIDTIITFAATRLNVNRKSADGRQYQNVFNQDVTTGAVVVKDGKVVASGNDMAWLNRCN